MADFKTHLSASTVLGIGYGGFAYGVCGMPAPASALAAGLCSVSGMLPDIDSGPGRPLREITTFMAAVVPSLLFARLLRFGMSQETIILAGAALYVLIRFGLADLLRRFTVHRGMFHSFPAAAVFGELTYLMIYGDTTLGRWFVSGGVVLGFLSHLCLDEIYSVQWNGLPRLKKSFGTAMKFVGEGWLPNLSVYGQLALMTFLTIKDPALVEQLYAGKGNQVIQDLTRQLEADLPGSISLPRIATTSDGAAPVAAPTTAPATAPAVQGSQPPSAGTNSPLPSVEGPVQEQQAGQSAAAKPLDVGSSELPDQHTAGRAGGSLLR